MEERILEILRDSKLRKTVMRKDVLQLFLERPGRALSGKEIEDYLKDPDRITVYRTLRAFEQNGVIHQAVDSSGTTKYALCAADCSEHAHHDEHAHFHCLQCGKTVCLDETIESSFHLPKGYRVQNAHLVLEGACADCGEE